MKFQIPNSKSLICHQVPEFPLRLLAGKRGSIRYTFISLSAIPTCISLSIQQRKSRNVIHDKKRISSKIKSSRATIDSWLFAHRAASMCFDPLNQCNSPKPFYHILVCLKIFTPLSGAIAILKISHIHIFGQIWSTMTRVCHYFQ